tara:strand:- start:733 stop:2073 length:1341 start_codon:yes stop_codon:yes gene_type:complete
MPRSVIPGLIDARYGHRSYMLMGLAEAAKGFLAFLASPAVGALSDVLGRKWLFVACVIGTAAPSVVLAYTDDMDVYLSVTALSGLLAATFPLAFAYISDAVPAQARASAFGLTLGIGLGLAMLLGPISGALLDRWAGTKAVFRACMYLTLANVVFAAVAMRELPRKLACEQPEGRSELCRRANPLAALSVLRFHAPMRLLSALVFFYYLAVWGFIANNLLYCRRRFQFTPEMSAGLLTVFGLVTFVTQSVGLRLAQKRYTEPQIVRGCFACCSASFVIYGLAWTPAPLYAAMVLLGVSLGGFACCSSIASQVVPPRVSGEAQGVLTSMKAFTEGVGPLLVSAALQLSEGSALPGAPWLLCAASAAIAAVLGSRLERTIAAHRNEKGCYADTRYAYTQEDRKLAPDADAEGAQSDAGPSSPATPRTSAAAVVPQGYVRRVERLADDI